MNFIVSLILIAILFLLLFLRGWIYYNIAKKNYSLIEYIKGCYCFDMDILTSLFRFKLLKEHKLSNFLTITTFAYIIFLIINAIFY